MEAPQEDRALLWPEVSDRFHEGRLPPPRSRFVLTAFSGGSLAAAGSLLGLWAAGLAAVPLDLRLTPRELAKRIRVVDSDLVLAAEDQVPLVRESLALAGRDLEVRALGADPAAWGQWLPSRAAGPGDPALVVFTSGTTGLPKGVLLGRGNLMSCALEVAEAQRLGPQDRVLNALSLAHVNAPVISLLGTVVSGGNVVLNRFLDPRTFWELAERDVTWANLVPPLIALLLRHPDAAAGRSLKALRFVRSASAPLPVAVMKGFEEAFGVPVVESYGISEASSQVTINDVPPGVRVPGSVGYPRGLSLRIVDTNGRALGPGEQGEVCVKGEQVMLGYLNDPEATRVAIQDGWLHTGDLGVVDEEGRLRLVGRIKELINRGGEKIAPRVIEEAALEHPAVVDAAAVGVPDDFYGEEVELCVVLAENTATAVEIRKYVNQRLSVHARPRAVRIVTDIPRNPSGKVMRSRLVESSKP